MTAKVFFRVSSGLKSIIGRELITDDFIAVFELVKNAFDANARRVDITFEATDTKITGITISDDGKGMDYDDITNKWLFVAYSAKKEGTEDYREKISQSRVYAGAKGIGRFSCDKLAANLTLLSRKKNDEPVNELQVNWDSFEKDASKDFIKIPIALQQLKRAPAGFTHGTHLKLTGLREDWSREKLLKLKRSLEKLINPNQSNTSRNFSIHIHAASERKADSTVSKEERWSRVNGKVENFVFEHLEIKTTQIRVSIPPGSTEITTTLEDRAQFVYTIVEKNPFTISGVEIHLFALNQSAKATFTRHMGVHAVRFGSVFLFKNGFRVYPYGEEGHDPWGIDTRKQQGASRHLGTRDIIGRVEIEGENPHFRESSSRDGGLVRTYAVDELESLFFRFALKRLERFAIDVIKWGNRVGDEKQAKAIDLILSLTKSKELLRFEYNPSIVDVINQASERSLRAIISQFQTIAGSGEHPTLEKDIKRAERRVAELERAKDEAESETALAKEEVTSAKKEVSRQRVETLRALEGKRQAQSQNLFLTSLVSADTENLVGLHHHVGISAQTIRNYVTATVKKIHSGKEISADAILVTLEKIAMQAAQIESATRFATKAAFSMHSTEIKNDIVAFIREYVLNVCQGVIFSQDSKPIKFDWSGTDSTLKRTFRPFEIVVLVDNLISNSKKAGARSISFRTESIETGRVIIHISDDGRGVKPSVAASIFELGVTTTSGSGFGLFHARKVAESMGGSLRLGKASSGATFMLELTSDH